MCVVTIKPWHVDQKVMGPQAQSNPTQDPRLCKFSAQCVVTFFWKTKGVLVWYHPAIYHHSPVGSSKGVTLGNLVFEINQ
jgi:hypothetical protein